MTIRELILDDDYLVRVENGDTTKEDVFDISHITPQVQPMTTTASSEIPIIPVNIQIDPVNVVSEEPSGPEEVTPEPAKREHPPKKHPTDELMGKLGF